MAEGPPGKPKATADDYVVGIFVIILVLGLFSWASHAFTHHGQSTSFSYVPPPTAVQYQPYTPLPTLPTYTYTPPTTTNWFDNLPPTTQFTFPPTTLPDCYPGSVSTCTATPWDPSRQPGP